jgi:cysteine dioxygenase
MTSHNITRLADSSYKPAAEQAPGFSLAALVETLAALDATPRLHELRGWLQSVEVEAAALRPHIGFKSGTYARHRVFRNEFVELLVLCWRPGQQTPIHDHNGSYGMVRVCSGVMWETLFELGADGEGLRYQTAREWTRDGLTGADVPDIHQLGNPEVSGQDLITLHLYAPPLGSINTYRVGRAEPLSTLWLNSWNPTI